ncbi:MAG: radical SAM family heme chaperone HemW [Candidatus Accumulibacter sp.]|jgi:oxygen-independent coproporphyrinogen-3 oxidase|nr:radical SAM family heme chaperone HemW [Accumulibacter sp.]
MSVRAPPGKVCPTPPLSLYVHLPWCVRKCPYCDFNSYAVRRAGHSAVEIPEARYVDALIADLDASALFPQVRDREVVSVFFGGGTPSLFSGEAIARLVAAIRARLNVRADAEITLEANPGTVENEKFAAFEDAGINRLSLGVQSFSDTLLKAIGRIHDASDARRAIEAAAQHFPVFNIDLISGLPGQRVEDVLDDVEQAIAFSPAHLSNYALTLEPGSAFWSKRPELPDADLCADMLDAVEERLTVAGYAHYEVSAFARAGNECRHNLNYWTFGDYLGIGAGAHGKLTGGDGAEIRRQTRWKNPETYIARANAGRAVEDDFPIPPRELPLEFMMNALRLRKGFDAALFEARTHLSIESVGEILERARDAGLIERTETWIRPTPQGSRFLNRLLTMFVPDRRQETEDRRQMKTDRCC